MEPAVLSIWFRRAAKLCRELALFCTRTSVMYRARVKAVLAVVVLGAILAGILLLLAFDVFCLLHLGTAESARFLPKFVWAVLIVCVSPVGGVVYLLAQRGDRRSAGLLSMPTRHPLGRGWSGAGPQR